MTSADLTSLYHTLHNRFDDRHWWPGETPYEVVAGAVLVQNTAWTNVQKAISNLSAVGALDPHVLVTIPSEQIEQLIRPCGYFRVKTVRLLTVTRWWLEQCDDDIRRFDGIPTSFLRESLLKVNGVGQETADSILLYALNRPVFVVDSYTRRILSRLGAVEGNITYTDLQQYFHERLKPSAPLFNDFHAQFVALGHAHCRKKPVCTGCPVEDVCRYPETAG